MSNVIKVKDKYDIYKFLVKNLGLATKREYFNLVSSLQVKISGNFYVSIYEIFPHKNEIVTVSVNTRKMKETFHFVADDTTDHSPNK